MFKADAKAPLNDYKGRTSERNALAALSDYETSAEFVPGSALNVNVLIVLTL